MANIEKTRQQSMIRVDARSSGEMTQDERRALNEPSFGGVPRAHECAMPRQTALSFDSALVAIDGCSQIINPTEAGRCYRDAVKSAAGDPVKLDTILHSLFGADSSEFQFMGPYDSSWMAAQLCRAYVEHLLKETSDRSMSPGMPPWDLPVGQDTAAFLPGFTESWYLTSTLRDFDVVAYTTVEPTGSVDPVFEIGHFGLSYRGMVISKSNSNNVYMHNLSAIAWHPMRAIFFRQDAVADSRLSGSFPALIRSALNG